ncbi:MAG: M48 family metallopeptidase [Novosphingobium sp.]|nr:M48 family metallopeptidase [Novosphingobium sp.]
MPDWPWSRKNSEPSVLLSGREVPVVIRRLAHARRMTMRLSPDGGQVRLSVPRWTRQADALAFVRTQIDWLETQADAVPERQAPRNGGTIFYLGESHTIAHDPAMPRRVTVADGMLRLGGPAETLTPRLRRWLESEARKACGQDLDHYCSGAGVLRPRLALSNAQRRWGSCAADGTIRINWRLIMAPEPVRRSVVAHEVAHLVHFDHSRDFHMLLKTLFEHDVEASNRWLKTQGRGLYQPFG